VITWTVKRFCPVKLLGEVTGTLKHTVSANFMESVLFNGKGPLEERGEIL